MCAARYAWHGPPKTSLPRVLSLLMYGEEGRNGGEAWGRMGGKEKWSASRAAKVVSLANETNIRADRVDKSEHGGRGRDRERERE